MFLPFQLAYHCSVEYVSPMFHFLSQGSPFIVCMTYAFHTQDKLCFILDLMNGGDLHYHLSQHGVFSEKDVRFYAAEVLLGKAGFFTQLQAMKWNNIMPLVC